MTLIYLILVFLFRRYTILGKLSLQERIDYISRIQQPKLLSDMQSFKAANAGACFQDFVAWYQIEPFDVQCLRNSTTSSNNISALDAATEAAQVLTATRKMWMGCWESSKAVPADCQQPLFVCHSRNY